jgi:hypothetical protein
MRGVEAQDGKHRQDGKGRAALHDHAVVWSPTRVTVQELRRIAVKAGFGHECDVAQLAPGSRKAAYYVSKYVGKSTDVRSEVPWARWKRVVPTPSTAAGSALRQGSVRDHYRTDSREAEAAAVALLGAEVVSERSMVWSPDEGCWVLSRDDWQGVDWVAWTPIRESREATYRTWSMSRTWGLTMAAVKAEAASHARLKAASQGEPPEGREMAVDQVLVPDFGPPPDLPT